MRMSGRSSRRHRHASRWRSCHHRARSSPCGQSGLAAIAPPPRWRRGRAGGQCDAGAALPDPHTQVIGADQMRKLHIGAFGKKRVMLDLGAKGRARSTASASSTKKVQCGLPMPGGRGARPRWAAPACRFPVPSGTSAPIELRRAHVDRGQPVRQHHSAASRPRLGQSASEPDCPVSSIRCRAMQRVALPQAADSEPSALKKVRLRIGRRGHGFDDRKLIKSRLHAVPVGDGARQIGRDLDRPRIRASSDDKVVAQPVHLHKARYRRVACSWAAYTPAACDESSRGLEIRRFSGLTPKVAVLSR